MRYIVLTLLVTFAGVGCYTTPTEQGALAGSAIGAGLGAIVGNQTGHGAEGALIGAGAGALSGALIGNAVDPDNQYRRRSRYHTAPAPPPPRPGYKVEGHYETRVVTAPSGERYEERVWVPHR